MPKVSVIVPVYNVAAYLSKCIESIQNQTEKDIEIILVNDGSTDESGAICNAYAEKDGRIKVIHQENSGQGAARNTGLSAACGMYVLFVDSDDWIEPDLVEVTVDKAMHTAAEMVIFDIRAVDEQQNTVYISHECLPNDTVFSAQQCSELLLCSPSPCNKLLKRDWLLQNQFAFPHMMYEDLIALCNLYPFVTAFIYWNDKPLYNYFLRSNSTLRNGNPQKTTEGRIAAVLEIYNFYLRNDFLSKYQAEVEWIVAYHGFFLPSREILSFTNEETPYLDALLQNLERLNILPYNNPYFGNLSKKEQLMFKVLYANKHVFIRLLFKVNKLIKRG
ncbi:MAG: glycosyltransferase family 2 protein [Candidatus Fimenecus sp.]